MKNENISDNKRTNVRRIKLNYLPQSNKINNVWKIHFPSQNCILFFSLLCIRHDCNFFFYILNSNFKQWIVEGQQNSFFVEKLTISIIQCCNIFHPFHYYMQIIFCQCIELLWYAELKSSSLLLLLLLYWILCGCSDGDETWFNFIQHQHTKKKTQLCHILFFSTRATKRKFFPRELCLDCWVCWVDVSSFHMFIFSKDFNLKSGENVISATLEQHKIIAIFRLKKEDSSNVNDDLSWDERYWHFIVIFST